MKTIAIANHKGGVGKTATTHALGDALSRAGRRVLIVDIDPQSSLTNACGVMEPSPNITDVLGDSQPGETPLIETIIDVSDHDGVFHLVPSDIELSINESGLFQRMKREYILRDGLTAVSQNYDVCLIDCPPSLSILTVNALSASDGVIVPTQPQITDIRGLNLFLGTLGTITQNLNPNLILMGILITFFDGRLIHHMDAIETMKANRYPLFETMIGRSIRVAESPAAGESVITYDPTNKQAQQYNALAHELMPKL